MSIRQTPLVTIAFPVASAPLCPSKTIGKERVAVFSTASQNYYLIKVKTNYLLNYCIHYCNTALLIVSKTVINDRVIATIDRQREFNSSSFS